MFTNRGAQLVSMLVPEKADPKSGATLDLVRTRVPRQPYPYALVTRALAARTRSNDALFRAEKER